MASPTVCSITLTMNIRRKLPDLKDGEEANDSSILTEARELAMDGGSADEKHEIFRKYKGKIIY